MNIAEIKDMISSKFLATNTSFITTREYWWKLSWSAFISCFYCKIHLWWTKHRTFIWMLQPITDIKAVTHFPVSFVLHLSVWHPHNKEPFGIIWTSISSNGGLPKLGQQFKFLSALLFLPCCRLLCHNSQVEGLPMTETVLSEELISFLTPCCFNWIVNSKKNLPILSLFLWSRRQ